MINIKSKNGITALSLTVAFVVLVLITGIGMSIGIENVKKVKDSKLKSELEIVQHAVLEQYTKYKTTKDVSYLVGHKITSEQINTIATELEIMLVYIPNTYENKDYYILDKASLIDMNLENSEDEYIVNYITGEVINITQEKTSEGEVLYIRANTLIN